MECSAELGVPVLSKAFGDLSLSMGVGGLPCVAGARRKARGRGACFGVPRFLHRPLWGMREGLSCTSKRRSALSSHPTWIWTKVPRKLRM